MNPVSSRYNEGMKFHYDATDKNNIMIIAICLACWSRSQPIIASVLEGDLEDLHSSSCEISKIWMTGEMTYRFVHKKLSHVENERRERSATLIR